jgi:uncharacterized protein (DUF488 family)
LIKEQDKKGIYTVGYATHTIESLVTLMKKFNVTAIVDVRSQPYSRFKPEFNRESLMKSLIANGIEYVFLGDNLGARIRAPECYKNGQISYELVSRHPLFGEGIGRLLKEMNNFSIAIMCAEKDPITCHRMILICKELKNHGVQITHIIDTNTSEDHVEAEFRLMKLYHLEQPDLFMTDSQRLERAYSKQEEQIAYVAEDSDQ